MVARIRAVVSEAYPEIGREAAQVRSVDDAIDIAEVPVHELGTGREVGRCENLDRSPTERTVIVDHQGELFAGFHAYGTVPEFDLQLRISRGCQIHALIQG